VSEYSGQPRGDRGRGGKEDKFLLCHSEEDTTLHNRGMILPQNTGEGKAISAEHLSTGFGSPSIFKQYTILQTTLASMTELYGPSY